MVYYGQQSRKMKEENKNEFLELYSVCVSWCMPNRRLQKSVQSNRARDQLLVRQNRGENWLIRDKEPVKRKNRLFLFCFP